ncbi:MAG: PCC domain-containing protein [Acutalibacteraceae bacterium]
MIALKENIRLASVQALGAVGRFTVGVFQTDQKYISPMNFKVILKLSLVSTINTMNHEFYCHLHEWEMKKAKCLKDI